MTKEKLDEKSLLAMVNQTIELDFNNASKLLEELIPIIEGYEEEIKYLQNKINEKKLYQSLTEDKKIAYDKVMEKGRAYNHANDFYTANDYYICGLDITNHPIFDYYIGKMLYKIGKLDGAYYHLSKYREHGGEKLLKSLVYLNAINYKNGNIEEIKKNEEVANRLKTTLDINFKPLMLARFIEKTEMNNSVNKKDKIKLDEDFFGQIQELRNLYRNGKISKANKILENLIKESENSYQTKKLQSLARSKTLYINQGKYSKHKKLKSE